MRRRLAYWLTGWLTDWSPEVTIKLTYRCILDWFAGASIPLRPGCISPCFRFPPCFRKILRFFGKFLTFDLFPKKFPIFIRQNFWWPFFSHPPQILNFPPILPVLVHFPPDWQKFLFPPYFHKFPPCFRKIHQLFTYFACISPLLSPWCIYASPNARTGRPCSKGNVEKIEVRSITMSLKKNGLNREW